MSPTAGCHAVHSGLFPNWVRRSRVTTGALGMMVLMVCLKIKGVDAVCTLEQQRVLIELLQLAGQLDAFTLYAH